MNSDFGWFEMITQARTKDKLCLSHWKDFEVYGNNGRMATFKESGDAKFFVKTSAIADKILDVIKAAEKHCQYLRAVDVVGERWDKSLTESELEDAVGRLQAAKDEL